MSNTKKSTDLDLGDDMAKFAQTAAPGVLSEAPADAGDNASELPPETSPASEKPEVFSGQDLVALALKETAPEAEAATEQAKPDPEPEAVEKVEPEVKAEAKAEVKAEPEVGTANPRDEDLDKIEKQLSPYTHTKTKKHFLDLKAVAQKARDELEQTKRAAAEEAAKLRKEADELRAATTGRAVPKEVEEELAQLRDKVRELDVASDPEVKKKYDSPLQANTDEAAQILKRQGLSDTVIAGLKAQGLTKRAVAGYIRQLKNYNDPKNPGVTEQANADGMALEDILSDSDRILREKTRVMADMKAQVDTKKAVRGSQAQTQNQELVQVTNSVREKTLAADIEALAKDFPQLKEPPAPGLNDPPAEKAAKENALSEWRKGTTVVADVLKEFDPTGKTPAQAAEIQGRAIAQMVQGVYFKKVLLPKILAERTSLQKEVDQLRSELTKRKTAGKILQGQVQAASGGGKGPTISEKAPLADAMTAFARAQGHNV